MINPNWNIFQAKFNDNPQRNFEWFCYLLFCLEFKKTTGIFRYKNQSGIETNPITVNGMSVGWQAKFYTTRLSDNKTDLVNMIGKSKRDYPNIDNIIFYTNQEWGQGKNGSDPQVKICIEKKAEDLGISIEWRTGSFFESPFVVIENEKISKHFFDLNRSLFDLLEEKKTHTENVLFGIQTNINFQGTSIEIDRSSLLRRLRREVKRNQILVVSGDAGVGKTALIKKLYEDLKDDLPFYLFKASEFNNNDPNIIFNGCCLNDFVSSHRGEDNKIIVIDSAEKLLDLENTDPFNEFLSKLIVEKWKIIFTTRNNYLDNLHCDFIEIYNIIPVNFCIENLIETELNEMAEIYSFYVPEDDKLFDLVRNPFYLNEYLRFYTEEKIDYISFKRKLWSKIIVKANPAREICFLELAFQRANEGQFFVVSTCDARILDALVRAGILGYETAGYFITHDIYEEWALEKKIAADYLRKSSHEDFFQQIGDSLPIRRSFRHWLSECLLLKDQSLDPLIDRIIQGNFIATFWQDELWISILLSDHSSVFFERYKEELLSEGQALLRRLAFLLRMACKEIDYDIFSMFGVSEVNLLAIKYVLTKPKGSGWHSAIAFIYDNLDRIGNEHLQFAFPLINEWNQKNQSGSTTRVSSLIALKYYQWIIDEDIYLHRRGNKENVLQTIVHGACEVKEELEIIFEEVLASRFNSHRAPYYDLMKMILSEMDAASISVLLPEYVLLVADLFWYRGPQEGKYGYSHNDIDDEFCLNTSHLDYYPSSPYQTPIYTLLRCEVQKTVDFILNFTNKTTENFVKSRFSNEVELVEVFLPDGKIIKQYVSDRLWCMYRGTQVTAHLLESIHMSLEKYFIEIGLKVDQEVLESWLLYLLKKTKSASISAVVTSIVLAYPDKTFNVAKVLFQTKEFFLYDTHKLVFEKGHKSSLVSLKEGFGGVDYKNSIHENERIKACDEPHREMSLEQLAFKYQLIRNKGMSEDEIKERQRAIWNILDRYYEQLPSESNETDADKVWRLFLARMDRRKMNATAEEKEDGIFVTFSPDIDKELKDYSDISITENNERMKYMPLQLWAYYKKEKKEDCKQYDKYENNPSLALQESKEIIEKLQNNSAGDCSFLINAIPSDVCSVLLTYYYDSMSVEEREYCKNIILEYSKICLASNYEYQLSDGVSTAITTLPILFKQYLDCRENIKIILLLALFDTSPIDVSRRRFNYFPSIAIHALWESHFVDMQSLLFGYLLLKPRYDRLRDHFLQENYRKNIYNYDKEKLLESFYEENEQDISKVIYNTVCIDDLNDLENTNLHILSTGFQLIPVQTSNPDHNELVHFIVSAFATSILPRVKDERSSYALRHDFLEKLAYFTLNSPEEDGFYPEFTDTSKKPIVGQRSVYVEEKKIQSRI